MGSDDGLPDQRPGHRVWVDALQMATCPVTNAEYAAYVEAESG